MQCTEVLPGIDSDHKPLCRNFFESVAFIFCTDSLDELISSDPWHRKAGEMLSTYSRDPQQLPHQAEKEAL